MDDPVRLGILAEEADRNVAVMVVAATLPKLPVEASMPAAVAEAFTLIANTATVEIEAFKSPLRVTEVPSNLSGSAEVPAP